MVTVHLPTQLSGLAAGRSSIQVNGSKLDEVFRELDGIAPMVRSQIFDSAGVLRRCVALFLNERQIVDVTRSDLSLAPGSHLVIIMSVAGG